MDPVDAAMILRMERDRNRLRTAQGTYQILGVSGQDRAAPHLVMVELLAPLAHAGERRWLAATGSVVWDGDAWKLASLKPIPAAAAGRWHWFRADAARPSPTRVAAAASPRSLPPLSREPTTPIARQHQTSGRDASMYRLLVTGDSITQGSSGDYTWRYRLRTKLNRTAPGEVRFVGTRRDLYDPINDTFGSPHYADPAGFTNRWHAARWGDSFIESLDDVDRQVANTRPDAMVEMLGSNDLAFTTTPAGTIDNLVAYVHAARAASPGVDIVVGEVTNRYDFWTGTYVLDEQSAAYNQLLAETAADLDRPRSRIVVAHTARGWDAQVHTYDGTHPNPTGETLIAQRVSAALAGLGVGRARPSIFQPTRWGVHAPKPTASPAGSGEVALHWQRTTTGASGMYVAMRRAAGRHPWERLPLPVAGDAFTVTGLDAGTAYDFRLVPVKGLMTGLPGRSKIAVAGQ